VLVVSSGRRGPADRGRVPGAATEEAADPGFGFRGLEEDLPSG
jgi:hypothetical protein